MKKRKTGRFSKNPNTKKELQDLLLSVFRKNPAKNYNYKQLYRLVGVDAPEIKTIIISVLSSLQKARSVIEIRPGKYKLFERALERVGIVKSVSLKGILVETEDNEDVFVGLNYSRFAFIGDVVSVFVFPKKKGRKTGEVLSVLKRVKTTFVGELQHAGDYAFVIPDNKKVPFDIFPFLYLAVF